MPELIVLQTHVDYNSFQQSPEQQFPMVRIFGKTVEGVSVQITVDDFSPYFYVQPDQDLDINELEDFLKSNFTKGRCIGIQKELKQNIYGYSVEKTVFYKIHFNLPNVFKAAKEFFEKGLNFGNKFVKFRVFESQFPFVLRFMHDLNITGMSYIKIKAYKENKSTKKNKTLSITTSHTLIEALPLQGNWIKVIPLKIVSFDIECCGETDSFPNSLVDPVIQIGNSLQMTTGGEIQNDIFCLKEVGEIPGANVHWFETEAELLMAWSGYIRKTDPDILLGYNIKNFDFQYLLERADQLNLKEFGLLGRTEKATKISKKTQSSSSFGSIETYDVTVEGRLIFDLFLILKREHKLRSYSLNAVSVHFLGEQKEDVPYSSMHKLQRESKETRRRIATYCLKDTLLPLRIFERLNVFVNYVELARATHVPIEFFSTRGASVKVLSLLYKEAAASGYAIPDMDRQENSPTFEGAFVMDPIRGFYDTPIAVLDFCSLYPSIIISKNLCYTTLLPKNVSKHAVKPEEASQSPSGDHFVKHEVKEGLLPNILRRLLENRKKTKKALKEATEPWLRKSLDGRQLALKVCANSIYGFTGAALGQLPCVEISQSTTAYGREMIAKTKEMIEGDFSKKNGFSHDTVVIYGDTDSVMLNFSEPDRAIVFKMAQEIAIRVSDVFEKPIKLEFEKAYHPYILMNKKRYAGLIYTNSEKPDRIDTKGIETVRRDNCELVKKIIDGCLKMILEQRDVLGAAQLVRSSVSDLFCDRVDLSQLVISKTYTKANYAVKVAHVELVSRLRERGLEVRIGDRIPYVIVCKEKKSKLYEKAEDPVYALEHNLAIDIEYYIENQLSKPIKRLFDPIMDNVGDLFTVKEIVREIGVVGPMNRFLTKAEQCIGCNRTGRILCSSCMELFPKHLARLQENYDKKIKKYHECWTECQRCMGSVMTEVICTNRDCPIFYMRMKVKKELEPMEEKMTRMRELDW